MYLLTLVSAGVLGMLSSLAPFLYIGSLLSDPTVSFGTLTALDIAPLLSALGISTLSMGYQNTKMVSGDRPVLMALICSLIFWISFALSSTLMSFNLV